MIRTSWLLCLIWTFSTISMGWSQQWLNGIAAIVNEDIITVQDIQYATASVQDLLLRQYGNNQNMLLQKLEEAQRESLDELVERKLILNEFNTAGFNLPESIINDEIQKRIREQFGDRATLTRTLQSEGRTFDQFRQEVREQIIVSQMRSFHINSDVIVSPYKIENYYLRHVDEFQLEDQIKLSMIFLDQKELGGLEPTRRIAMEILAKLGNGAPFREMAGIYSQGSQRREGGDWGWVEKSVLREDLAQIAFGLAPGKVSGLIEKPEGIYIMRVDDARLRHIQPLSEVKDEIEKTFRDQEIDRRRRQWVDSLKTKFFHTYF